MINLDTDSMREQLENRWKEFHGDEKNSDTRWVRSVLHSIAETLPFLFSWKAIERGVQALYKGSDIELPADFDWISADEDLPDSSLEKLPIFRNYRALRAYAHYGLKLSDADDQTHDWTAFLEMVDSGEFPQRWLDDEEVHRTINAAYARQKLDYPERGLGLLAEELAALAGVSRKSIMNMLSPKSGRSFKTRADGSIDVESAREWLLDRPGFHPSIWHLQEMDQPWSARQESLIDGDPAFVPIARDGTWFSPEQAHDGQFFVSCDEQEKTFEDYWEALAFLNRMIAPKWQYCDQTGQWHVKIGRRWERKPRRDIERMFKGSED